MSFIAELKRRNVFRVALLYVVASWVILQVADVGISLLGLPETTGRLAFLLLAIAFPLVMLFSWAYEITPDGVKREIDVDRSHSVTHETAKKLDLAVIVLLLVAIGGLALHRFIPSDTAFELQAENAAGSPAEVSGRSIAVLPFVNMSDDPENGYFSDGLAEELLNLLARIPELHVAARTSSFRFKESNAAISEIAGQLKVAHVLEGSVRKSGNEIRITAQLINASDGFHLWSDTWDRSLEDVFAIQDEIAAAVVDALRVTMLGELPKTRKTDPEAYELYLQSKQAAARFTKDGIDESIALLTQALAIDPEFSQAWTELGTSHTNMAGQGLVAEELGYPRALAANERALELDPLNARALSGQGWIAMYWEWDFPKAARLIKRAMKLEPGNASVINAYAVLVSAFGRQAEALGLLEEALSLDPLGMSILTNLCGSYLNAGRLDDCAAMVERMREVETESLWIPLMTGWVEILGGNAEAGLDALAGIGAAGDWPRAIAWYDLGEDAKSDAALEALKDGGASLVQVATTYAYRNEPDLAFEWLEKAIAERDSWAIEIRSFNILLSGLHADPRWDRLLAQIGITDDVAESTEL